MPSVSVGALCFIRSKFCQLTTIISVIFICLYRTQNLKSESIRHKKCGNKVKATSSSLIESKDEVAH